MKISLSEFLSYSILIITVSTINHWIIWPIGNTFLWWAIDILILTALIKSRQEFYNPENNPNIIFLRLYLIWNIICITRGICVADNYWEWKNLISTTIVLLLPFTIYISTNESIIQKLLAIWIKFALPAFFIFLPLFKWGDGIGRYLVPISFLLLFFAVLPKKWKVISVSFALFVISVDLDARSNVIKFAVSLFCGMFFYFRLLIPVRFWEVIRLILLILPIVLFVLATTGIFNIFQADEYLGTNYTTTVVENGEIEERSLVVDTRTLIYEEVLTSAIKNNYVFHGRTPARGNDSELFGLILSEELQTGKMERFGNEVSILNIFTWTGLVGVILYFLMFYYSSFLALRRSNNTIIKLIGLFVAFRWTFAWVEDFSDFDLSYFFLWIMIGMCLSKSFRNMSDLEIKSWVHGIFDKDVKQSKFHNSSLVY